MKKVVVCKGSFEVDLEIDRGSTFRHVLTWKVKDQLAPGETATEDTYSEVDLTGCTAEMQIRASQRSSQVLYTLSTTNGTIVLGDLAGTVEIYIPDEDTRDFDWTIATYGLEVTFANGDVRKLTYGKVSCFDETTR